LKYRGSPNLEGGPAGYPAAAFRKKRKKGVFHRILRKNKKMENYKKSTCKSGADHI